MTGFSDEAWQRTAELREAIHKLPFNTELAAGTQRAAHHQLAPVLRGAPRKELRRAPNARGSLS